MSSLIQGFKPMLAGTVKDTSKLVFPLWGSPKLDGVRAEIIDGLVLSRSLKPIPNRHVQSLFKDLPFLDGELIVGSPTAPNVFRTTGSAVTRITGTPDVKLHVFDRFRRPTDPFDRRFAELHNVVNEHCVIVPCVPLNTLEELEILETTYLNMGYEGLMLRKGNSPYKFGRSTFNESYLLKLKRFLDSEAVIVGFEEQMYNSNEATTDALGHTTRSSCKSGKIAKGTLGAIIAMDIYSGVEFNLGKGFDAALGAEIWANKDYYKGKIVKYKYFPIGIKDKPRFSVLLGFRDPIDMGE